MHEVGLAQQTLDIAMEAAHRQGAQTIRSLRLKIGEWSGVEPEALRFALELVVEGTCAHGAEIVLEPVPPACRCPTCDRLYSVANYDYRCPGCGGETRELFQGREMDLVSLEVA